MPETILIVDDTPANLGVLVETLGAAGYQLMVAEDGEEALAQTAQTLPDLILLDVMMPGLDGFETCRRLKARRETRDVPVLFMTALTETVDKVKAFSAGAVDYLTKPIEHDEAIARVRTHLTLRRLQRELATQLAQREQFIRIASHDLRHPLGLILLAGELARRGQPTPELAGHLTEIHDAARQIRHILDTFLSIERHRLSSAEPLTPVDVNILAETALAHHQLLAEQKKITLAFELADDLPLAQGRESHIAQVFSNYLTNALKFTPPGGRVVLRTRLEGMEVRAELCDSGPGVPEAERGRLFQEYAKLSPRPTAGEESHGLGLAIVKNLVETQGGRVGADFPSEGGSIFWFELRAVAEPAGELIRLATAGAHPR